MNGDDLLPASLRLSRFNALLPGDDSMQQLESAVNEVLIPEQGAAAYWYVDPSARGQVYNPESASQDREADENKAWAYAMGLIH